MGRTTRELKRAKSSANWKKKKTIYKPFDAAAYLDNDAVIAEYLSAAAEDSNPEVFVAALGDVAKARGPIMMKALPGNHIMTNGKHSYDFGYALPASSE